MAAVPAGGVELVERRIRVFLEAFDAGFFFPGRLRDRAEIRCEAASVHARLQVEDLAVAALGVLGGVLTDCRHHDVSFRSAHALLGRREHDLSVDSGARPAAVAVPPFKVELPPDLGGNSALLIEIEFAQPVEPRAGQRLLDTLALWDTLTLAYPDDPDEAVEVSGAQAMFNDPRTIHYHEWIWDNADADAWNLIVNLCCAWHVVLPVVRLHFE
ncbi:hypothetical protein [Variovorax defluvii]|uniref:hypothetical protein n=1 Tax=Variovorax defluvii TaxID=913761 RepID=UPI0031ED00F4